MTQLAFAHAARRDLTDIVRYIALDNPTAAKKVAKTINAVARRLCDFPEMGHAGRISGTREFPVPGLPYVIVYEANPPTLTVLAVFHGSRDLARALAKRMQSTSS